MKDFIFQYTKNMTQKTEKRYQHLSKPLLSGAIFVASVGLIGAGALAASSSLYNLKAENPTNQNRLTASNWDTLVSEVENLKDQLANQAPDVPSGAVMAFDSPNCPEGWTRFTQADGRFIMGSRNNSKETGGENSINLTVNQLPPHKFHLFADEAVKDRGYDKGRASNQAHHNSTVVWENNHDDGDDNFSYTMAVSTDGRTPTVGTTNTLGN